MEREEIERVIGEYIEQRFPVSRQAAQELQRETPLFQRGIVDSIGILSLVRFLEERFQLQISPTDLVLDNFASIAAMSEFVLRRRPV